MDGDIAQLGERLNGIQEAVGSSPIISIIIKTRIVTGLPVTMRVFLFFHALCPMPPPAG